MKIDVNKIDEGRFVIREENNEEYINELSQSLLADGQWNPIILRPKEGGRYEIVAGHYRLKAAKKAKFKEIEATVRDLNDEDADVLSIKTNLLRLEMTAREQGKVLSKLIEQYKWSQREIAKRLNVGTAWVGRRLRVALDLHEIVAKALDEGKINFSVASVIGGVPPEVQPKLLSIMLEKGVIQIAAAERIRRKFLNDTIFTIGYQGINADQLIKILKENGIELLLDVRYSSDSQYKPEFSGTILKREVERNNIKYLHRPEYGLPYVIQNPYKEEALGYDCVKQWYQWHVSSEKIDFDKFIEEIKSKGKTALMCMERYAKPKGEQKYACHRDILADLILQYESEDSLMRFEKRIDL